MYILVCLQSSSNKCFKVFVKDLSLKVNTTIQPVFASRKIEQELNVKEAKPPIVNEQCVVYNFQSGLCDAGYVHVRYTCGLLHKHVKGHKQQSSAIAKRNKNVHGTMPQDLLKRFGMLKKCRNKFECLVYEMLFINQISTFNQTLFMLEYFHNLCTLLCYCCQ